MSREGDVDLPIVELILRATTGEVEATGKTQTNICDLIAEDVQNLDLVLSTVAQRLLQRNENIILLTLGLIEKLMEKADTQVHTMIVNSDILILIEGVARCSKGPTAQSKALQLIKKWKETLEDTPQDKYSNDNRRPFHDIYSRLENMGITHDKVASKKSEISATLKKSEISATPKKSEISALPVENVSVLSETVQNIPSDANQKLLNDLLVVESQAELYGDMVNEMLDSKEKPTELLYDVVDFLQQSKPRLKRLIDAAARNVEAKIVPENVLSKLLSTFDIVEIASDHFKKCKEKGFRVSEDTKSPLPRVGIGSSAAAVAVAMRTEDSIPLISVNETVHQNTNIQSSHETLENKSLEIPLKSNETNESNESNETNESNLTNESNESKDIENTKDTKSQININSHNPNHNPTVNENTMNPSMSSSTHNNMSIHFKNNKKNDPPFNSSSNESSSEDIFFGDPDKEINDLFLSSDHL